MYSLIILTAVLFSCNQKPEKKQENQTDTVSEQTKKTGQALSGKYVRIGHSGPIALNFKDDGTVESDLGNDNTVDIVSTYRISGDTIFFVDMEGKTCPDTGMYIMHQTEYYTAFDLIQDNCGGRIKSAFGFWVKPDFESRLTKLNKTIENNPTPELHLNRARMLMAVAKPQEARMDFDEYLKHDTLNARVYINRAATRFPNDWQGIVDDCNKAIDLSPDSKNAYFLKGIALYSLGKQEEACESFSKAIDLGFTILKTAEQNKCAQYWEDEK